MTSLIGRLADKANIIKSSFSEIEKAVIKATRHNLKGPKEKHVRRLIVSTFESPGKNHEIITLLAKRLEVLDWIVVMKTLEVFHRILRDGNGQFINDLKYKSTVFNLRNFKDVSSPEAHYQSVFIQKYGQYLEEKVLVFKMLNVEFEKDPTVTRSFTVDEAFEKIPRLQSQLNALLNCRASKGHINNPIIVYGFTLLLKDSFKLYRALNDAIIHVLEHYFSMSKSNAQKALDIYKLFTKETDGIIQFFDITRKFSKTDLPELQHAPTTLVEALENYVREADDSKSANSTTSDRGKKLAQQMDLFSFDDTKFNDAHAPHEDSDSDDEKSGHDFGSHHQQQQTPQRSGSSTATNSQPSFDPFSFEDTTNSHDALPTFSTTTSNNIFDDPFGGPPQQQQQQQNNQPHYVDKRKQIENVMAQTTGMKPLQPNPVTPPVNNNTGFGNQPNTGFGNNNMGNPFGQNTGFGNQPNNTGFGNQGFGNQPNTGFGNQGFGNQPNTGFGNNTGFANQPNTGFGNNNGFGNQPNTGFGNNNNMGFGNQPNNTGFGNNNGFGNQPNTGFGNNNMGFGNQPNNNTGFGGQNNNNPQANNPFFSNQPTTPPKQNNNDFNPFA